MGNSNIIMYGRNEKLKYSSDDITILENVEFKNFELTSNLNVFTVFLPYKEQVYPNR